MLNKILPEATVLKLHKQGNDIGFHGAGMLFIPTAIATYTCSVDVQYHFVE